MGQKVNPHGLRVGVIKDWDSRWYAEADFADTLLKTITSEHSLRRNYTVQVFPRLRSREHLTELKIIIYTAKPGIVIGKGGSEIEKVKAEFRNTQTKKLHRRHQRS